MAKLTRDDVLKLADLAKLELSEDEVEQFTREISAILGYVEQLQSADVEGLEPTNQVTGLTNVVREDTVVEYQASPADLMARAPATENHQYKVKKIL